MSLIDSTYFKNDVSLTSSQLTYIQQWITEYEPIFLKLLLGFDLYKLLETDLGGGSTPTESRFVDLVDGKEFSFEVNGYTVSTKWEGLRDSTLKKSVIAYYVYYQYRNETESFNTGAGQGISNLENAEKVSAQRKLRNIWNKMVDIYGVTPKNTSYPKYYLNISNYEHYNIYPTAYNFLLANKDDYSEWVYEPIKKINKYNL